MPWLVWLGGMGNPAGDWECRRCGARGTFPVGCTVTTFLAFHKSLAREHRDCRGRGPSDHEVPS
jgi:hypothetical protein